MKALTIFCILVISLSAWAGNDERAVLITQSDLINHCKRNIEVSVQASDVFNGVLTLYIKEFAESQKATHQAGGTSSCCGYENWDIKVDHMEDFDLSALSEIAEEDLDSAQWEFSASGAFDEYLKNFDTYSSNEWGLASLTAEPTTYKMAKAFEMFKESEQETMTLDFYLSYTVNSLPGKTATEGGLLKLTSDPVQKAPKNLTYGVADASDPLLLQKVEDVYLIPAGFRCTRKMSNY